MNKVLLFGEGALGINSESDRAASLVIGPTSLGMVRIFIESEGVEVPMDFDPDEAREIATELQAAADRAEAMIREKGPGKNNRGRGAGRHGGGGGG